MRTDPHLYRVTTVAADGTDPDVMEILGSRGDGGAAGAAMALLTLGGTRPTTRRVSAVADLGPAKDIEGLAFLA